MSSIILWKNIHEIADAVCKHFELSYGKILPVTRMRVKHYGECRPCPKCTERGYDNQEHWERCKEKILYLRLHQLNKPRVPLATSTILQTLAHELAHLREWRHGPKHDAFELEIMEFIRDLGYEV